MYVSVICMQWLLSVKRKESVGVCAGQSDLVGAGRCLAPWSSWPLVGVKSGRVM